MMDNRIWVNSDDIENMIAAVYEMTEALYQTAYDVKAKYLLDSDRAAENSVKFIQDYMDVTGATLRMIASTTGLIAGGIANGEIKVSINGGET